MASQELSTWLLITLGVKSTYLIFGVLFPVVEYTSDNKNS